MTDTLLIVCGVLFLLAGLAGCLLPVLPGPPVSYLGVVALHMTERVQFTNRLLLAGLLLVVVVQVVDTVIPVIGTKRWGGTRWGIWGCVVGSFVGLFFFLPFGFVVGSFVGAVVGELLGGKNSGGAFKAGFGSFAGFLLGTVLKFSLCGLFVFWFWKGLAET